VHAEHSRARSPRVLLTTAHLRTGGVARIVLRVAPRLRQKGWEVFVCHLTPYNDFEDRCAAEGIAPLCVGHRSRWRWPLTLLALIRLLRRLQIDLVHTNHVLDGSLVGIAARLLSIPVVTMLHNTFAADGPGPHRGPWPRPLLDRWLQRQTARYLAVSGAVRDSHLLARGLPADRITVLHSGIDVAELASAPDRAKLTALRRELGLADYNLVLLNVARLHEQKGQRHLIPAMSRIVESHGEAVLLVAGEGEERAALEEAIRASHLDNRVHLLGRRSDVPHLLAVADLFVFPSVHGEGLPLAVLEACAAGKAVVAARTPPVEEILTDGVDGLLVPPGRSEELARAVIQLLDSLDRRREMGRRAQELARQRFSLAAFVDGLGQAYSEVLGSQVQHR
jgi:glycosyltransferase involved in cell wall biosynthesis